MASKEVKSREAAGEDLSGKIWEAEKPYLLVRDCEGGYAVSFFVSREDFDYAVAKAMKNNEEIAYAAEVVAFKKIDGYKSGFGRKVELGG